MIFRFVENQGRTVSLEALGRGSSCCSSVAQAGFKFSSAIGLDQAETTYCSIAGSNSHIFTEGMSQLLKFLAVAICLVSVFSTDLFAQRILIEDFETNLDNWTIREGAMRLSTDQSLAGRQSLFMDEVFDGNNWPNHVLEHNTFRNNFGRYEYHFYCDGPDSDADLYFQYIDENSYYKVSCKPSGTDNPELIFCKGTPQGEEILFQEAPTFGLGEWYKVTVERFCDGHIHVWINDDLRVDLSDFDHLERGGILLRGWASGTYLDEVYFEPFQAAEIAIFQDTICQGDSLLVGGIFARESGVYYDTISAQNQFCVEVAQVDLTVLAPDTITLIADLCWGDSAWVGDRFAKTPGRYVFHEDDDGCGVVNIYEVVVRITTVAQDSFIVCPGTAVEISPGDFLAFLWEDGSTDNSLVVTTPGQYQVQVIDGFCDRMISISVYFDCNDDIAIPTAFTPNGDGVNDFFGMVINPGTYNLMIFDRWGSLVFQADVDGEGWDGKIGSDLATGGVYVYQIMWSETLLSGVVNLVR